MNPSAVTPGVAADPLVFIGLVTHPNTRFTDSKESQGLVRSLERLLPPHGVEAVVMINDENLYVPDLLPLSRGEVRSSISAELDLEARWRLYLNPGLSSIRLKALMKVRGVYRRLKFSPPWKRELDPADAGPAMLRRLVNIELAHITLMRAAVDSGAAWALLLEDDASAEPMLLARALASFVKSQTEEAQPLYVNVSKSFGGDSLGISDNLNPIGEWDDGSGTQILRAEKAATNTVCAVLYRTSFLSALLEVFQGIPLSPVLPIDWKLNEAILQMQAAGLLSAGDCWFIDPPPVVQRSME